MAELETIFGDVTSKWSKQSPHIINVCMNVVLPYMVVESFTFFILSARPYLQSNKLNYFNVINT